MEREELLQIAKPILFNTKMVKVILEGRKTVTRRVANKVPKETHRIEPLESGKFECYWGGYMPDVPAFTDGVTTVKPPYKVNDVLYVRETWKKYCKRVGKGEACHIEERFAYKADGDRREVQKPSEWYEGKWRPSIHMPKEAARLYLRVTDVRVERLQDITEEQAQAEGCNSGMLTGPCTARGQFENLWNSTIKKDQLERYGWAANPYVWVIEFEQIEAEQALAEKGV